ncbi:MAG: hypothetical protein BM549_11170 [Lacinutrix sp. MedPE-SW]|nr:MAG: hypothetical protein BM549_11170 [Lacinutrix sp. MedPE-SW]
MVCKNCKRLLPQQINFCNGCGAKVIRNRLTMRNLFEDIAYRYINYDNQFLQTIITLLKKPELVIDSYINGARKCYVNPISFFAINLTLSGFYIFIIQKYFGDVLNFDTMVANQSVGQQKINASIMSMVYDYGSLINSLIIPFLALISVIVFYNKKYNYTEHIVLFLYTMSLFSLVTMAISLIVLSVNESYYITISMVLYIFAFIYHCYVFKRLFKLSAKQLFIKILFFIPIFFMAYIGMSLAGAILFFIFSDVSLQDFAPKN